MPLRDDVGRALYEEPGRGLKWDDLSEQRKELWRRDADRIIPIAVEACAKLAEASPRMKNVGPSHVRAVSGVDIAATLRALFVAASAEREVGS